MAGKMRKAIIFLVVTVITVCTLISCSAKNNSSENNSTTVVTDVDGKTHYYEPVTDENGMTITNENGENVYAEIVTDSKREPHTDKSNNYLTKKHSVALSDNNSKYNIPASETKTTVLVDNEVAFEDDKTSTSQGIEPPIVTTTETTTTKTETTTNSVTDANGWINKWY